jgi:anthranilate phosphoribosyltransferase
MSNFGELLKRVAGGAHLDASQAAEAFGAIMRGEVSDARMAALLTALSVRKPTVAEIVGAVRAMRNAMQPVRAPENAIDVCGTGGDGRGTLNVSTATAFVVAGCGVPVAKHGNRSMSSQTGAADVLDALDVPTDLGPEAAAASLRETGFCFLFAPRYHAAMKHVAPVRRDLGFRTIFNLIGPLSNPAGVHRQLIGVFSKEWLEPVAESLRELGAEAAWIVHSDDGLDEISIAAPTQIVVLEGGAISRRIVTPEDAGLLRSPLSAIAGGDARTNAAAICALFAGERSGFRDIVVLNAAAALLVAGHAPNLREGAALAEEAIDSGRAKDVLARSASVSELAQ